MRVTISVPFAFIPYEVRMYKNIVIWRKITMLHIVIVQIVTSSCYYYFIFSMTRLVVGNYVSRCQCPIFLYQNSSTTPKTWGRIVVADRTTPIHKQLKFTFPWQRVSAMKYSRWCTIIEYSCGWENKNWKQKYLFFLFVTYAKLWHYVQYYNYNYLPVHLLGHFSFTKPLAQFMDSQNGGSFLFPWSIFKPSLSGGIKFPISFVSKYMICWRKYNIR